MLCIRMESFNASLSRTLVITNYINMPIHHVQQHKPQSTPTSPHVSLPFLSTPNIGTTLSLIPCTLSINPASRPVRGLPVAGVLLGQAHNASKSICSSWPDSSECRLGTRVASRADKSSIMDREGGFESGVFMVLVPKGSMDGGLWMGERCTEKSVGGCENWRGGARCGCWKVGVGEWMGAVSMPG